MSSPPVQTSSEAPIALKATGIRKTYRRNRTDDLIVAIEDFDLTVARGEFVTIVGPSGCGKSTFLNMVNGLVTPSAGQLTLFGTQIEGTRINRAMVFQDASLFPWYTVERNVAYGLRCRGADKQRATKTVSELIDMVGLTKFASHYPHELSGGMQQRVNLARALAVDPDILLMDEPFAALDAQTREVMQAELLRIWALSQKTVLFITHDISEAVYLSDRVVVMSARPGRILADIKIDVPRPRSLELKHSPDFALLEGKIWNLLENQVQTKMKMEIASQ